MEQYKLGLCFEYFDDCEGESDILRSIVEGKRKDDYEYKLNADGKLHSRYLTEFGCYEPAVIHREPYVTWLFWLFDGEIKNYLHPFMVMIDNDAGIVRIIEYYSLERIQQRQPIYLNYSGGSDNTFTVYNRSIWNEHFPIIDDPNIPSYTTCETQVSCDAQFITIAPGVVCPLWPDEFGIGARFKFED